MAVITVRRPEGPDILQIPTPPQQSVALFIIIFFTLLALVAFCLRVWSRVKITRQWGLDDSLMVPAEVCAILMFAPFIMYCKLGYFGWRQEDVPADFDPAPGLWWFYLAQIFYNPILALVKCSVLVFILRLGGQRRGLQWAIYGLIAFTTCHAIGVFFGVLLQCLPIEANWDPAAKANAVCIDNSFHIAISSLTILTDILVLALPFYVFLGLKMAKTAKMVVICVFLSGGIVTAISIVRVAGLIQLFYFPVTEGDSFYDIKMTLSVVEVNLAVATACVPTMRPLFKLWFPTIFGGSTDDHKSSGYLESHNSMRRQLSTRKRGGSQPGGAAHITMMNLRSQKQGHTEIRGTSPTNSEEVLMSYNGIVRTMDVSVSYDNRPKTPKAPTKAKVNWQGKY